MKLNLSTATITVVKSGLLPFMSESGPDSFYMESVMVTMADGREFLHHHSFGGTNINEDGITYAYLETEKAERLANRVRNAGVIDLAHWELIPEGPSLEERLQAESEREAEERQASSARPLMMWK